MMLESTVPPGQSESGHPEVPKQNMGFLGKETVGNSVRMGGVRAYAGPLV